MAQVTKVSRAERRAVRFVHLMDHARPGLDRLCEATRWIRAEAGRMDVAGIEQVVAELKAYALALNEKAGDRR